MNRTTQEKCKQCEWYRTGAGNSKNLHTCRPSCAEKLFVEGAGEFYCNSVLPCSKHTTQEEEWERWVRTLSDSSNPRDTDLLVAKIAVLLRTTRQQAVEEERERVRKAVEGIKRIASQSVDEYCPTCKFNGYECDCDAYNEAVEDVLALLTSTDKSV